MTVYFTSTEKIWGKNHFKCPNLILNYSQLSIGFTQTSPRLHFSFFIFRALKPCDQGSPISVCNGNQSTSYPARSQHEWPWMARKRGRCNSRFIRLLERKTHLSSEKSHQEYLTIFAVDWSWRKSQSSRRTSKNSGGSGVKTRCKF